MDVTAKNLTSFKGKVGLTPAVVYIATFLTHQYRVHEPNSRWAACDAEPGSIGK